MSHVDDILGADERVVYRTSLHWIEYVVPVVFLGIAMQLWPELTRLAGNNTLGAIVALPPAMWVGFVFLRHRIEEYVVTTERLITRTGILARRVSTYPLDSVATVEVSQGIAGRILGYGSVEIHTQTGSAHGTASRQPVSDPHAWQREILSARQQYLAWIGRQFR